MASNASASNRGWFDRRAGFSAVLLPMMRHPVPTRHRRADGLVVCLRQRVDDAAGDPDRHRHRAGPGLCPRGRLGLTRACCGLDYQQPLGWFLRALHYYAGSGMVVLVLAHMTQVFLHGAYKYPRELTWIVGVVLSGLHAGDVFYRPGAALGSRRLLGAGRRRLDGRPRSCDWTDARRSWCWASDVIGGDSLSRFFALHVFVIPGLLLAALALHLWLVLQRGISAPPLPGETVDPADLRRGVSSRTGNRRRAVCWARRCSRTFSSRPWA